MSEELKPCPHCGNAPHQGATTTSGDEVFYLIVCENRSCGTIGEFVTDRQQGIEEWNRRPIEDRLRAERDALKKLLKALRQRR